MSVSVTATTASGAGLAGAVPVGVDTSSARAAAYATAKAAAGVQSASQAASSTNDQETGARPVAGPASSTTIFSQYKDKFLSLSSVVLNVGNKYDLDAQFRAYMGLQDMSVTGKLRGIDPNNERIWMETSRSSVALMKEFLQQMVASVKSSSSSAASNGQSPADDAQAKARIQAQAELKAFDAMSSFEQKVYFNSVANASDNTGNKPFTDMSQYRAQLQAIARDGVTVAKAQEKAASQTGSSSATNSTRSVDGSATASYPVNTEKIPDFSAEAARAHEKNKTDRVDLSPAALSVVGQAAYTGYGFRSMQGNTAVQPWDAGSNVSVMT